MKIRHPIRSVSLTILFSFIVLFASMCSRAQNILQTQQGNTSPTNWDYPLWGGPPGARPTAGNAYESPSGFDVRTTNSATALLPFLGASLQLDAGSLLYLKNGTNTQVANLILNGGTIDFHGGFAPTAAAVGGSVQVIANSLIESDQSGANNANIWLQSSLSGTSNLSVNMVDSSHGVLLFGTNSAYSGNWTNITGIIEVMSGSSNALGSGSVTLNFSTSTFLVFNTTNNMVVSNSIMGIGNVIEMNTNIVTLAGTNTFTGYLQVTNGGTVQIGAGATLTNASSISLVNGTVDASLVGGLTLGATQSMNCNGTVIGGLTASGTASGTNTLNFNFTAVTNSILNVNGALTLDGNPNLNVTASGFITPGTYRLINYTGTIQGGGSFNLVPPAGSSQTFQLSAATAGQVNLIVGGTVYNITWVGDGVANNWDTTTTNWTGGTNLYSDGDKVTFNDFGSASPAINVAQPVAPGSVTINNNTNYYTFGGFGIAMAGSFTKTGTNEVDLISTSNNLTGPVTIQAGVLSLGNGGITTSLGTPSSITNNGILQVNELANGVAFNSPISGSGSLNITGGGASVTIGANNSYTGTTTIGSGCQLNISKSSALGNSASVVTVMDGGRLGVSSSVGTMSVPQPLVVGGTGIGSAPGAIYVNTTGNNVTWAGPVTLTDNTQFRTVNVGARDNFSNTVLGTNVNLECTSGNTVGDSSTIMAFESIVSLGSSGSLTADGLAVVILAGGTNIWGGGTTLNNAGTLLVNGTLNGGPLAVNNPAILGGSGVILDPVTVDGTLAPGNLGIGTLTVSNTVTFNSDGTAEFEINRTSAPNASLLSAPGQSITYGGTLTVNNVGSTNLQAGDSFTLFNGALGGTFSATNLPALPSSNMFWDTSLLAGQGIIKVGSSVVPQPVITSIKVSGATLTITATNGADGGQFVLLESTNLMLPVSQWTPVLTNNFDGSGDLNLSTNVINSGIPQEFYLLSP
jgi:fibronectin-binding autotransporter adhesin